MKYFLVFVAIATVGCTSTKKPDNVSGVIINDSVARSLPDVHRTEIDLSESKEKIHENRNSLPEITGDFNEFKVFINGLEKYDFYTISTTADYLTEFLPKARENFKDSAYIYFVDIFYRVANYHSESLSRQFPATMKKFERNISDGDTSSFKEFLSLFGIGLYMSEGEYYLDVNPDYFLVIFEGKVSKGLNEYLKIRSKDLEAGFSEDAGLLIGFDKVYERVLKWETLSTEYPDFILVNSAKFYCDIYLETMLTGMDNSRVFSFEDKKLLPEIKNLYDSIIKTNADRRSTRIVKGYYKLLAENDFKYSKTLDEYLKVQGLSSMLGVQPHSR